MTRLASVLVLLLLAGCASDGVESLPRPPPLPSTTTSTTAPDYGTVVLERVPGTTTTSLDTRPGKARISGVVNGPDGPVPFAQLRIERLVGDGGVLTDTVAGAAGEFVVKEARGGRYRIRAWRAPDLAMRRPFIFFLGATETKTLNFGIGREQGMRVESSVNPDPPQVSRLTGLQVQVTTRFVDDEGIIRATPVAGTTVELFGGGQWSATPQGPQLSDPRGRADWQLQCEAPGEQPLSVVIGTGEAFDLGIKPCVIPPPPTTMATPTATSSTRPGEAGRRRPTTTARRAPTTRA